MNTKMISKQKSTSGARRPSAVSGLKAEARRPRARLPSPSPPCCPASGHSDNDNDDLVKDNYSDDHVSQLGTPNPQTAII